MAAWTRADYKGSQGETPTANTALLDPTVRIAIAKAIDKDTLVTRSFRGGLSWQHPDLPGIQVALGPRGSR